VHRSIKPEGADVAQAFVRIDGLTKRFSDLTAVDAVSLEVVEGHTLALLGPSGCGKTTILRCIAGLETPERGTIDIAGTVVFDQSARINLLPEHRGLGIVFQSYAVWPHMSVGDNVGFPLKVRGVAQAERRQRVARVLELVGLETATDKPATELSGGQQQRVALARALIHEPRLVLFDEPMSNLDAQLREQVRMELQVLQRRLGFTAIYVTHDQAEAFALAETVVVMDRGRIEAVGPPREVFLRPASAVVARFLGFNVHPGRAIGVSEQVRGCGAGRAVRVAIGPNVMLWGVVGHDQPIAEGSSVLVCIRKEHIGVRQPGLGAGPAAAAAVPALTHPQVVSGKVCAASFLGLAEEYIVAVDGVELRAIQASGAVRPGDPVDVAIKPQDCLIFAGSGDVAPRVQQGRN
jgi:ABC-type Fe3+/spermidine/putrescine transport system ATPase subunit